MESSKYLIAGGVTDWVKSLEPFYAEDEKKRRRHAEELRQRDAQALQVMKEESPIKDLERLSLFSQKLGKLSQQRKAIAQQKDQTDRLEADVLLTKYIKDEEWAEINRITKESVNNLKFDGSLFKKNVLASTALSTAAKKALTAQHGSSIYRIHEALGFRSLQNLDAAIEAYGATDAGKAERFQVQLEEAKESGDHLKQKEIYKKFAFKQFNQLGFDDRFIALNFSKPLEKYLNSRGVLAQLMYEKVHHTERELDFEERFNTARKIYDNGDKIALTNEFHSQLVEANNDKDSIARLYYRLGKSGNLTRDEFRALKEGDLPKELNFKAGDKGDALLSKEQWALIERGISEKETADLNSYRTAVTKQGITAMAIISKPGDKSAEELIRVHSDAVQVMKSAGLENTDTYKVLSKMDPTLQSPAARDVILEENKGYLDGPLQHHRLKDKENFKTIANHEVNKLLNGLVTGDEQYYRDIGLPTTHKDHVTAANHTLKSSDSQKKRISGLAQVIDDPEFKALSKEIALKRQEFHTIARSEHKGNNVRASAQAEDQYKNWLIANGINEVDTGDNPNAGFLSPTVEGVYRISAERRSALSEKTAVGTRSNTIIWTQDLVRGHSLYKGDKNKALDTANVFTSHGDIQNTVESAYEDVNGTTRFTYSPEIIFKARALRIQPSQLILRQLQALKNGDAKDRNFYERYKLNEYEEDLKKDPAIKIEEALENYADAKLLFLWRRGVEYMSGNQLTRLIDELAGFKWQPDDKAAYSIP